MVLHELRISPADARSSMLNVFIGRGTYANKPYLQGHIVKVW